MVVNANFAYSIFFIGIYIIYYDYTITVHIVYFGEIGFNQFHLLVITIYICPIGVTRCNYDCNDKD